MPVDGPFCPGCPNQPLGERFIEADGSGASGILFVGDSPWKDEVAKGKNFSGAAGFTYEKWLEYIGEPRSAQTTANSMWCRPPRLGWTDAPEKNPDAYGALQHCRPYLDRLIQERHPRVIVPMGNVALRRVVGVSGIEQNQGYVHDTPYGIPAVPTFHPSFVMQGKHKFTPIVLGALRRAQSIARVIYQPTKLRLILDPPINDLATYIRWNCGEIITDLTVDIETPESLNMDEEELEEEGASFNIVRAGFSIEEGIGVSFPWEHPYIGMLRDLVSRAERVWEWTEKHFDSKRLRPHDFRPKGVWASAMNAFHFWQSDLPKGLGFVAPLFYAGPPWKHLNAEQPAFYSAMDNSIQHLILYGVRRKLVEEGRWRWFERHCIETDPILVNMGRKGVLIDQGTQAAFMWRIREEWEAEKGALDTVVPAGVKNVKRWKRPPRDMTDVHVRDTGVLDKKGKPIISYERVLPFNPESPLQVKRLIQHLGFKVPFDRRANSETTGQKHLKRFAQKHPLFARLLRCRQRETLLTMYDWTPNDNGRVMTEYNYKPSTWRKASRNINLQNIPKRGDLAQQFRRMIVSDPGCVFVAADSAAIEAVLVGYYAGSEQLIRLAKAGIHGWLSSCKLGNPIPLDLPDTELSNRCKLTKKENPALYEMCKRVVYLSTYMGTPQRILEEYPDDFSTLQEARDLQGLYFETKPGKDVKKWQNQTIAIAHKEYVLKIPFGYWHYFYDVLSWNQNSQQWRPGDDAKRAVAFRPQATASAIQTEAILWLRDHASWIMPMLNLIIHDELVAQVPDKDSAVSDAVLVMTEAMTQPWPQLGGLSIGVEVKVGKNLGEWSPDNPDGLKSIQ